MLKTSDYDYNLPEELIAQTPSQKRDESRLLIYNRKTQEIEHRKFYDVLEYLKKGDALVVNETRVLPARLNGKRADTGGRMEMLLLTRIKGDTWEVLCGPAKRAAVGREFIFGDNLIVATVLEVREEGIRIVELRYDGIFEEVLDKVGVMPLPPYIHAKLEDKERYQTVYSRINGSAAAPTAGLHFTDELMDKINKMGVTVTKVLLHVGLGTFRPVKADDLSGHKMHSEYYEVNEHTANTLNITRKNGGRIICVGTTSARTLETATNEDGKVIASSGWTDIFIYPGYEFRVVDSLITNFHLPKSTLLMMISALAGRENMLSVYKTAVNEKYRFFSFGDAMFII